MTTKHQHPDGFTPLSSVLENGFPKPFNDWFKGGGVDFLDNIGLKNYHFNSQGTQHIFTGELSAFIDLSFDMGGINVQLLSASSGGSYTELGFELTLDTQAENNPPFKFMLKNLRIDFQVPAGLLYKAEEKDGKYTIDENEKVSITPSLKGFGVDDTGRFYLDSETSIKLSGLYAIGKTGLLLKDAALGLREAKQNQKSHIQFLIPSATLILPADIKGLPNHLSIKNGVIDKAGFSGKLSVLWQEMKPVNILGFDMALSRVSVAIDKNQLTETVIKGQMGLPFFDNTKKPTSPVDIEVGIGEAGKIVVGLVAKKLPAKKKDKSYFPAIVTLDLDYFKLQVSKLHVDGNQQTGKGTATLSGRIVLDDKGKEPLAIEVKDLKIKPNGDIDFPGGWFDVKDKLTYDQAGFKIGISKVGFGFGLGENKENFIGFNGGVRLAGSLPAAAEVEGFKYFWDKYGNSGYSIKGVSVDFTVPGAVKFGGKLSFFDSKNPSSIEQFNQPGMSGMRGKIELSILPLPGMNITADLLVAKEVKDGKVLRFWMVYMGMDLPVGIPIGPNIAFYGLQGLIAENMLPTRKNKEHWYRDWYRKTPVGVEHIEKWQKGNSDFAFGVGATLGTAVDNGYLFNARALFLMQSPGPLLMLSGKANFLQSRAALVDPKAEPLFRFLMLYDGQEEALLFNLELTYIKDKLLDVRGLMELFFHFRDPSQWHLYLGEKPKAKRINAKILDFLQANAYLMVDADKFAFGFFVGYGPKEWNFGPIGVKLAAYLEGDVVVSWSPEYFNAHVGMHGELAVRIFFIQLGLLLKAGVTIKTPKPFLLDILAKAKLTLPFPLPSPELTIHLQWKKIEPPAFADPFHNVQLDHQEALGNSSTWETDEDDNFSVDYIAAPVDSVLNLVFERTVDLSNTLLNAEAKAAQSSRFRVGKDGVMFEFDYQLSEFELEEYDGNQWVSINSKINTKNCSIKARNIKTKGEGQEQFVIQINSTDPMRAWRQWRDVPMPESELQRLADYVCPDIEPIHTICWTPPWDSSRVLASAYEGDRFEAVINGLVIVGAGNPCGCAIFNHKTHIYNEHEPESVDHPEIGLATPDDPTLFATSIVADDDASLTDLSLVEPLDILTIDPAFQQQDPSAMESLDYDAAFTTYTLAPEHQIPQIDDPFIQPYLLPKKWVCIKNLSMRARFHQQMTDVRMHLKFEGKLSIRFFNNEHKTVRQKDFDAGNKQVMLQYPGNQILPDYDESITGFFIQGDCVCIDKICYTTMESVRQHHFTQSRRTVWKARLEQWQYTAGLLFDANKIYRLRIKVAAEREQVGSESKSGVNIIPTPKEQATFEHIRYFKTDTTPQDLSPYIGWTTPMHQSKLAFRSYLPQVQFKAGCSYIPILFSNNQQRVDLVLDDGSRQLQTQQSLTHKGETLRLTRTQEMLRKSTQCYDQQFEQLEKSKTTEKWLFKKVNDSDELKPQTRYKGYLVAVDANQTEAVQTPLDDKEIRYSFEFTTSRFNNFDELIRKNLTHWSFNLDQPTDLSGQRLSDAKAKKYQLSATDKKNWHQAFNQYLQHGKIGHDFIRKPNRKEEDYQLRELAKRFNFPAYLNPEYTEIHQIRDKEKVYGFLVQFAEPIDWDRTELEANLSVQEKAQFNGLSSIYTPSKQTAFAAVRHKDGSQLFIMFAQPQQTMHSQQGKPIDQYSSLDEILSANKGTMVNMTQELVTYDQHYWEYHVELKFEYVLDFLKTKPFKTDAQKNAFIEQYDLPVLIHPDGLAKETVLLASTFENRL